MHAQHLSFLLLFFASCSTSPTPPPAADYYIVAGNTLGLREGMIEVGNVVTFSDSSMTIYEPSRPEWSATYRFRGDSLEIGNTGRWGLRGDSLLVGPQGNDYRLKLLTEQSAAPLADLLPANTSLRGVGDYATNQYFGPRDTLGTGCFVRYAPAPMDMKFYQDTAHLSREVIDELLKRSYRSLEPEPGSYGITERFGVPLLWLKYAKSRLVYEVDVSSSTDTLRVRGYNRLSPTNNAERKLATLGRTEALAVATPNTPVTLAPVPTPQLDSIGWSRQFGPSDAAKHLNTPFEFELDQLRLHYADNHLTLSNGGRQLWRMRVARARPDLLFATEEGCASGAVFPLRVDAGGRFTILVPMYLRQETERQRIADEVAPRDAFSVQFRWQPFGVAGDLSL